MYFVHLGMNILAGVCRGERTRRRVAPFASCGCIYASYIVKVSARPVGVSGSGFLKCESLHSTAHRLLAKVLTYLYWRAR